MILVCGEALIDCFVNRTGRTLSMRCLTGGSPYNLAVGLARLGRDVSYFGAVSDDLFGDHLCYRLACEGVTTTYIKRSTRPTTLSFIRAATGSARYSFRGGATADRDIVDDDLPRLLGRDIRCVTFGSYSLAVEPIGSALERFALGLDGERVISLDPNIRPSLIENRVAWQKRLMRLLRAATIVKVSDEDLFNAFGTSCDINAFATRCLADGASLVIVTRGPRSISLLADSAG
jgi:fructokinase